jgi:hypothetical protein
LRHSAGPETSIHARLLHHVLAAALAGLEFVAVRGDLAGPANARLALRELGLSIGLAATATAGRPLRAASPHH